MWTSWATTVPPVRQWDRHALTTAQDRVVSAMSTSWEMERHAYVTVRCYTAANSKDEELQNMAFTFMHVWYLQHWLWKPQWPAVNVQNVIMQQKRLDILEHVWLQFVGRNFTCAAFERVKLKSTFENLNSGTVDDSDRSEWTVMVLPYMQITLCVHTPHWTTLKCRYTVIS